MQNEQTEENVNPLKEYFKLNETLEFDTMVGEYVTGTGNSPFLNIDLEDGTGQLNLDMDKAFNKRVEEKFGEKLDEIISDYFLSLIEVMQKELEEAEK